ncbi:MAG: BREX system P-loop protein BrxC [Atopobiaceae bacterium]|nr:BREX system P-loop protein BrxC [Atopobiaceae bacterium]
MQIQNMFAKDINRYINGVVDVSEDNAIRQELEEYVVTHELQRHFDNFFESYERGLDNPARNTGVWIQGYFGSGKSHFLKMLSYLLENRIVNGEPTVSYFADKFEDPMTYAKIERASRVEAETILFNIDQKGGGFKEGETAKTAVLRTLARVFYDHLGFYGRDYKLARFEKMIDSRGKTEEFRAAYEDIAGSPWVEDRESYEMFAEELAEAANRACGLSIQSVADWADSTEAVTVDFGELIGDINEYCERRAAECGGQFRLLFMVDEMGQYLNSDVNLMLNLQTFMEQIGAECKGRVWMVVTSQEAIDEMMLVVGHDFSKIQGRFTTRLSLSSSSVDEVIKKRVLDKTGQANILLQDEYERKSPVLKNLFTFEDSRGDLRGYATEREFTQSFPFVGYQFTLMPNVLKEIRKHGYQGKSLSTGERSMLSSYQEAAQSVEGGDETSLVPFWRFFDTLEKELDHGIKQVFERCRKAADGDYVIRYEDIDVLKTLYLINYISDVKPTLGNIAILMVDNMDADKVALRERVKASLDRLVKENYVSRTGERYAFLTDEEQDVAREIRDEQIDPSAVIDRVKSIIFDGLYNARRYRKGVNDFPFDRYVDDTIHGLSQGGMKLDVVTMANPQLCDASDAELDMASVGQALIVLATQSDYYDVLYNAAKIKKYCQTHSREAMQATKRKIVEAKAQEAAEAEKQARELIADAIVHARCFVDGHGLNVGAGNARQKIEAVLDKLVDAIFTKASLIDTPIQSDRELRDILAGKEQRGLTGMGGANEGAARDMERYLEARFQTYQPTTMGDVQRRFQGKPYGWREIDVAAVMARLLADRKVYLTFGGAQVPATDNRAVDLLRKATMVDKVSVKRRESLPAQLVASAKSLLRELDSYIVVPNDEDELVEAVKTCLSGRVGRYRALYAEKYANNALGDKLPGRELVEKAIHLAQTVMEQSADARLFLQTFVDLEDDLLENAEDLEDVDQFFSTQLVHFDEALTFVEMMGEERSYVEDNKSIQDALARIIEILELPSPYRRIQDLPKLCGNTRVLYDHLVKEKRAALQGKLKSSIAEIEDYASSVPENVSREDVKGIVDRARREAEARRLQIEHADTCSKLDALGAQLDTWKETQLIRIDSAKVIPVEPTDPPKPPKPKTKVISRSTVLPTRALKSEEDVNAYVEEFRLRMLAELEGFDSIRLGQ